MKVNSSSMQKGYQEGMMRSTLCLWLGMSMLTDLLFLDLNINFGSYFFLIVINSTMVLWNMINIKMRPYSIFMFVNLFIYAFFILANAIQYSNSSNVLTFYIVFQEGDYIEFQFILMILIALYSIIYNYGQKNINSNVILKIKEFNFSSKKLLLISLIFTFLILAYYKFNPYLLFARGIGEEMMLESGIRRSAQRDSNTSMLLFNNFIRLIPWACCIIGLIFSVKKRILLLLGIGAFLTVCPTGIPRNAAAMCWIPIVILVFRRRIKGHRFLYLMFIGLLVIFPLLDNFRRFDGSFKFNFGFDYLDSMNFDASQVLMAVIKLDVVSMGRQLLGVLFFFVPRSIWPDKPIGSGHFLVTEMGGWFTNVSMPVFAEGYMNFGFLGMIIFTILLALFSKKMDNIYWSDSYAPSIWQGYYYISLGAVMFIMRGDLMSSFAYTVGICCCYYFVSRLVVIRNHTNSALIS